MLLSQLGDYSLIKELGQGSLGNAYLAQHVFLKRYYVIKVLPDELVKDADFLGRFEMQIPILSQLDHPHIATIYNATCIDGHYVILSEAIAGASSEMLNLDQYLRKKHGELSEEEILRIAKQIASALDYARTVNGALYHGMLKLNNIALLEGSEGVHVALTDFGLSEIVGPAKIFCRTLLHKARLLGIQDDYAGCENALFSDSFFQNFAFLAPEQKQPHPHQNNSKNRFLTASASQQMCAPELAPCASTMVARSEAHICATSLSKTDSSSCFGAQHPKADIYAFGILLYYLLVGEFPEGYFDLPSKRLGELRWNWDLLICKCLQTDPAKRPEQLSEKIDELLSVSSQTARNQLVKMKQQSAVIKPVLKPKEIARPSFDADPGAIFQTESAVGPYRPKIQEQKEIEPILSEMVIIPAGSYFRGSNQGTRDEMPRHAIHLSSFAIDVHPVTNEQFVRFLEAMGGEKDVNNSDIIRLRESRIKRSGGNLNIESGYARHPVVGVTWYGAVAYTKWVGKRLPTEAEWEIAAFGGREDFLYPTGLNIERSEANFFSSDTTAVMSYPPNGYGLYDIAGNVYEWCHDWYDFHYYDMSVQEPNDPKGPMQGVYRVLRGGCWKSLKEDLRCAHRHRNNPGVMNGTYGFRCAADVCPDE